VTDPYEVLGVARDATQDEIKSAYRRASSAAHPDREGGSAERQQQINDAYAVLGDPGQRKAYDEGKPTGPDQTRQRAFAIVLALFDIMIDREQPGPARGTILKALSNADFMLKEQITKARQEIKAAESWKKALKPRSGKSVPDIFKARAEERIAGAMDHLRDVERQLEENSLAIQIMDDYEDGISTAGGDDPFAPYRRLVWFEMDRASPGLLGEGSWPT